MKATRILHDLGQSIWLDNITRDLLKTGWLRRYIDEFSVTGLTSNPTIFDHAIKNSGDYDDAIKNKLAEGKSGEKLFFELALDDLTQAADCGSSCNRRLPRRKARSAWQRRSRSSGCGASSTR
jgi:transaldolase